MKFSFKPVFFFGVLAALVAWAMGVGARDEFLKPGEKTGKFSGLTRVASGVVEPPSTKGKYGGTMTDTTLGDPKTFNMWVATDAGSFGATGPLYDSLIGQNGYTLKWEAHLSDLPQVSKDGKIWTFRLKPNLKWSDGQPLNADDVIFTLDMIYDPKTQGIMREGMLVDVPDGKNPDGTKKFKRVPVKYRKLDDRTVQFTLPTPYAPAMSMLNISVASRHKLYDAWKNGQINSAWSVSTPPSELVANGSWILQSYVPGQRMVYVRNPYYWKKDKWNCPLPYFDKYVQLIVPDVNTMTLKFKASECDTLGVQAADYPTVKADEKSGGYTVFDTGPSWGFTYLSFNMNAKAKVPGWKIKLFSDVKFRQAVSYAINRDLMCINLYRGLAEPGWAPETPADKNFYNPKVPKYPYDPKKAEAMLDAIGVRDTDGNGYREFEGHEVQFNIITNVENGMRKSVCTVLSKDLRNVGLNATFTPIAFNSLISKLDAAPYDWEACVLGFTGGAEPHDGANIWFSSGPSHQWNPNQKTPATKWEAEIDDLFRRGAQQLDPKKRRQIYGRWQVIAATQLPFIYTVVPDSITAVRNKFGNLKPATRGVLWNQDELYDLSATRQNP